MPKKKRRRRPGPRPTEAAPPAGGPAPASDAADRRRERKEEARRLREQARRRFRRQRLVRRGLVWGGTALAVGLGLFFLVGQGGGGGELSDAGKRAAAAAGCTGVQEPDDLGRSHTGPYSYSQQPPTSGPHDPSPLGAGVYDTAQDEARMVHSLEHGAVEIYYEASGDNAIGSDLIDALAGVAEGNGRVIMTPASQPLSAPLDGSDFGVGVAFAAWDRLVQCPPTMTPGQGRTLTRAFIEGFVNADSAPEAGAAI